MSEGETMDEGDMRQQQGHKTRDARWRGSKAADGHHTHPPQMTHHPPPASRAMLLGWMVGGMTMRGVDGAGGDEGAGGGGGGRF
jgi:hypothetical protein